MRQALPPPLPQYPNPLYRELGVFAIDPALSRQTETFDVALATLKIRWDDLVGPGPQGKYLDVIDFDPASGCYYTPADLEAPACLAGKGITPTEADPRFHGQMVYAVAMHTIQNFEAALGRRVLWSPRIYVDAKDKGREGNKGRDKKTYAFVEKLRIYPHALRGENAYYDPERKALLFGYFPARDESGAQTGGIVFSALSFDIVCHETTHAILDGLHRRYVEDTNPDVLAFHEAFSDIVALFSHFGLPEFLRYQIASSRGDLDSDTMLAKLAVEFGKGIGKYGALRDAIGDYDETGKWVRTKPSPRTLRDRKEPHERGSVLVSAVFDAFLSIYKKRTGDLMRIATGGTGILHPGEIDRDLVKRLADEAAKAARHVLNICIRALDYVPPVDVTFFEYLRALLTADHDAAAEDALGYRVAFIEAFERWGIVPDNPTPLGEASLRWQTLKDQIETSSIGSKMDAWQSRFHQEVLNGMDCYRRVLGDEDSVAYAARRYEKFKKLQAYQDALDKAREQRRNLDAARERSKARDAARAQRRAKLAERAAHLGKERLYERQRRREEARARRRQIRDAELDAACKAGSERHRLHLWSQDMAVIVHGLFGELGATAAGPVEIARPEDLETLAEMFGISPDAIGAPGDKSTRRFEVHSVRSLRRPSIDPLVLTRPELVIVLTQRMWVDRTTLGEAPLREEGTKDMKFRGGSTIIYDLNDGEFRYVIRKDINSRKRRACQRDYQSGNVRAMYFDNGKQPFRMLHEEDCP